jgi:peptide/nickel transport system substrate-binding protein
VTKQPDPILPLRISYADLVSPKTSMTAKTTHPVGTGPYEFASRTPGQNMKFKRFAGYWGAKPQAANVTYIFRSENAVRADTAKTNEAGIAVPIALQDATSNSRTRQYTQDRVFFLRLETNKAPLNDIRVRQAIGYAIDKNKIVGALMGKGGKPTDQMLAPSVNGYIPGYQGPSYDLGKAKSMLAAAKSSGVDTSKQIKLITRGTLFPGSDDVLQAVVQGLNDAGLNVKMIDLDDDAYLTQLKAPNNTSQPVNMMAVTHDNESGDASFSFPKYLGSTGAVSTIHDPQLDTLLNQANLAEGAQRASLYQQAARWEYEHDAAIVPIAEQFSVLLLANGVEYTPNGLTGIELKASDVHFTK